MLTAMTYAQSVELAHEHLAGSGDIAVYPDVSLDVMVRIQAHLGFGPDVHRGETLLAMNRDAPMSVLGMSNAWVLTSHRFVWLSAGEPKSLLLQALRSVRTERGVLGSSLHVEVAEPGVANTERLAELTVEVPDVPAFAAFFRALLEIEPAERSEGTPQMAARFADPRTRVLAQLLNVQAPTLSNNEVELRCQQLRLFDWILWNGRPLEDGLWWSPLAQEDFEAVMPWIHGKPYRRSPMEDHIRVRMRKSTISGAVGEKMLDMATFGVAGGISSAAGAVRAVSGALAAPDVSWSRATVDASANEVHCRIRQVPPGVGFRYIVASTSLTSAQPFSEGAQRANEQLLARIPYDEGRALLLRWLFGAEPPLARLLAQHPEDVTAQLQALGVPGDYATFVVDLHGGAWCERLSDIDTDIEPIALPTEGGGAGQVAQTAAPVAASPRVATVSRPRRPVGRDTTGEGWIRLSGVVQMGAGLFSLLVAPFLGLVGVGVLLEMLGEDTFVPLLGLLIWVLMPLGLVQLVLALILTLFPRFRGLHTGVIVLGFVGVVLGGVHGLLTSGLGLGFAYLGRKPSPSVSEDSPDPDGA